MLIGGSLWQVLDHLQICPICISTDFLRCILCTMFIAIIARHSMMYSVQRYVCSATSSLCVAMYIYLYITIYNVDNVSLRIVVFIKL